VRCDAGEGRKSSASQLILFATGRKIVMSCVEWRSRNAIRLSVLARTPPVDAGKSRYGAGRAILCAWVWSAAGQFMWVCVVVAEHMRCASL